MRLVDKFGRTITDLRISITHHCNYKCVYCRTGNEGAIYGDLPFPIYLRIVRLFASAGIKKVTITGGEPLLRKGHKDRKSGNFVVVNISDDTKIERKLGRLPFYPHTEMDMTVMVPGLNDRS